MRHFRITLVAFITYMLSHAALANAVAGAPALSLEGRSLAEHCSYVYRIETDFGLKVDADAYEAVVVWLKDRYVGELMDPVVIDLNTQGGKAYADFMLVTMSTNPRYSAHEVYLALAPSISELPDAPTHKATFSQLMNRCYTVTQRQWVGFQPLTVQKVVAPH